MALEAAGHQYKLDSSRERWFSDALSDMSISDLDEFFSFFAFTFDCRKHHNRKNIVVRLNRIEKKFYCRYEVVYPNKTKSYYPNNIFLDSHLDFDFDFLLEKTALMLYLVENQKWRKDILFRWLFSDWKHGGDPNIEFLREYWFHQPDKGDNTDANEIFRVAMKEAQRMLETWKAL